jgi:hypothetical protein
MLVERKKGRPLGAKNKATEFIKPIAQRYGPECIEILMRMARNPKVKETDRRGAAEVVLSYGFGTPTKSYELSGPNGGPMRMSTSEEKKNALDQLLEQVITRLPDEGQQKPN